MVDIKKKLKKLSFSCDLVQGALNQLEFLREINSNRDILFKDDSLKKACYRYESLWLPLYTYYSSDKLSTKTKIDLVPPLDIEFIWHCHMLNPTEYYNDTIRICGKLLEHKNLSKSQRDKQRKLTKPEWDKKYQFKNISFDYLDSNSVNKIDFINFKTNIKYDLIAACNRQINFYYQVSLPHYNDKKYLKLALQRYTKFLYLSKLNPTQFIVPCYSIDLIWHTHQLNPLCYTNDTNKILGRILLHDDSDTDRSPGMQLDTRFKQTSDLWTQCYNEPYIFPGGLYRGERKCFESLNNLQLDKDIIYHIVMNSITNNEIKINAKCSNINNSFTVKMKYLEATKTWTNVQLLQNEKLISSARLVNLNELPSKILLPDLITSLNTRKERAMILTNINGDFALIKGKIRKTNSLLISYISLIDDNRVKFDLGDDQDYVDFELDDYEVKVDFKSSLITIEMNDDNVLDDKSLMISYLLTFIFGFICLYLPLIGANEYDLLNMFNNGTRLTRSSLKKFKPEDEENRCGCFC